MSIIAEFSELPIASMNYLPKDLMPLRINLQHVCLARAYMFEGRVAGTRVFLVDGSSVVLDVQPEAFDGRWREAVEGR